MANLRLVTDSASAPNAVDKLLAEHVSPVTRAQNVFRRVYLDPDEYPHIVREIARQIVEAEQQMLKGSLAIIRETFGNPAA